jgi:hypothetical protein
MFPWRCVVVANLKIIFVVFVVKLSFLQPWISTRGGAKSYSLATSATTLSNLLFPCNLLPKSYRFCCCATC